MVNNSLIQPVKPGPVLKTTIFSENHWSNHGPLDAGASHSDNFDHLRRPETLRTAMATAFFCPTNTTSLLPLVRPV